MNIEKENTNLKEHIKSRIHGLNYRIKIFKLETTLYDNELNTLENNIRNKLLLN